ncbi:MAG: VCBS repeat-containing protein [Saprospiraceae bacterium]
MRKLVFIFLGNLIWGLLPTTIIAQEEKLFTLLTPSQSGISFSNDIKDSKEQNILLYANFYGGAGVGVGDFNGDGLPDLYFAGNLVPDKLYLNQGNLNFKDVTNQAGIQDDGGWSTGVTVADINNDGHLDIYVSRELYDHQPNLRTNLLYINKGDGTFTESAKAYGIADDQRTRHATFLDYDKDGFLDLFLLTQPPNPGSYSEYFGTNLLKREYHLKLLKNTQKGTFVEVSKHARIKTTGFPNGVSASDVNNDGWPDLYVANDFYAPDYLFINNRDGTFSNKIYTATNHISYYSMGVDVADINNDGLLDIFVVDMVAEDNFRLKSNMSGMNPKAFQNIVDRGGHYQYMYNTLQLNNGNETFSDVAQLTGMAATDWSWSNLIADFDNDGLKDVYVTNGLLRDIRNTDADKKVGAYINQTAQQWIQANPNAGDVSLWDILDLDKTLDLIPSQPLENYAFKNKGNLDFEKITTDWGLNQASFSNGSAYADLDLDGDLDIVVNNINAPAFVYQNNATEKKNSNFLRVQLADSKNKPVFGTKVKLYVGGEMQLQETTNVRGIYSTSENVVHFGLGAKNSVDSLVIIWPNQQKSLQQNIAANQTVVVNMREATTPPSIKVDKKSNTYFNDNTESFPIAFTHQENEFDDYEKQVLLPHKLSQFGPALAKGDINEDGLEDIFIGGAMGFSAELHVQKADGSFVKQQPTFWQQEKDFEDVDAIFTDFNGDGYDDLYVVSGGNAFPANDALYKDRLYWNDGKGNFSKGKIQNNTADSGSKVKAADYDNDGDIDLFIGGRHLPHQYPMPASSQLLRNDNGQLVNVTDEIAEELNDLGLVTDAVWNDYDLDGDLDLTIVGEWMRITFFKNENGQFIKQEISGLENSSGWWFGLEKGDFDKDGDIDFIVGNLGLNYKYQTSLEEPFDIYYEDFDGNGQSDIVLGYYNDNKHFPLRGFSCSSSQIPELKTKIKKYDIFASMEIDAIYGNQNLQKSLHYKAHTFASSYVENLGNGQFKLTPLPQLAQTSNLNDFIVSDFNKDGHLDVLGIGNLFVSEIETPRNDAGTGTLLLGDGKGEFSVISSKESGIWVRSDAKKMIWFKHKGKQQILVANNADRLQCFTIH